MNRTDQTARLSVARSLPRAATAAGRNLSQGYGRA